MPGSSVQTQQLDIARLELLVASGEGLAGAAPLVELWLRRDAPEGRYARALTRSVAALAFADAGRGADALAMITDLLPAIQRSPAGEVNLPCVACNSAWALWIMQSTDHIEAIEKSLREKIIAPDHRFILQDGRLALARICALTGRYDEANDWFAKARTVLDEDGQRPLRAIVDYDEALMYARRNTEGDRERALPLLDAAMQQFAEIGMTGWTRRGQELRATLIP